MPYFLKWFCTLGMVLFLSGCGEPTLDTSSEKAMEESAGEIMAELSEDEKSRFKETIVGIYTLGAFATMSGDVTMEEVKARVDSKLHGKSAQEIFQMADDMKKEMNQ